MFTAAIQVRTHLQTGQTTLTLTLIEGRSNICLNCDDVFRQKANVVSGLKNTDHV